MHKEESQIHGKDCDFTAKLSSEKKQQQQNANLSMLFCKC